jgi:hypothetical protein
MQEVSSTGGRRQRGCHIPQEDLILCHELQMCEDKNWDYYLCSCKECHGGHYYRIRTIQGHLRECGRDLFLMRSMVGGDPKNGFPVEGIWIE